MIVCGMIVSKLFRENLSIGLVASFLDHRKIFPPKIFLMSFLDSQGFLDKTLTQDSLRCDKFDEVTAKAVL